MTTGQPAPWEIPLASVDEEVLGQLVQAVIVAADIAAMDAPRTATFAERARIEVTAALRSAIANRLVNVRPVADWPEYIGFPDRPRDA